MAPATSWKCPKCIELNLAVLNFEGYVSELCDGSKPLEIHKTGMLFRDYMILLRLIDHHKASFSVRDMLALQELMPFSIKGLIEAEENQDRNVLFHNLLDAALTEILKSRLKNSIISVIDTDEKLKNLDKEAFGPLIKMCQDVKQVTKNIIYKSTYNDERNSLKRLKYFREEVLEKVGATLIKFSQTNDRETFMVFVQLIIETGLIRETPAEVQLENLLELIDMTFERLIEKYQDYQQKVGTCRLLSRSVHELKNFCIEEAVYSENWYQELPPLIHFFVEQLVNSLRQTSLKLHSKTLKYGQICQAIRSNIQFLFFSFEDTSRELTLFVETERNIIEWERKVNKLEHKLKEAKEIDENSLLYSDRRSQILVSFEEFTSGFRCLHQSEAKFIKDQPKYKSLLEKENLARNSIDDEDMTFQDVMNDYVRECIPLTKAKLSIIEREALRFKVDQLLNATIMIKECDLMPLEQEFAKLAVGVEDERRLAKLKQLRQDLELILDPNYPENIDQSERLENVKAHSHRMSRVFIEGPCKEKIKKLCRVINFISEIEDYLNSQGIYFHSSTSSRPGAPLNDSSLKDVDWTKMDFLKKSLFFKNKYMPLFPDIEAFVHKIYSNYMVYLVEQASAHGEKTDVSTILLIETIKMHVRDKQELNPIYQRRRDSLLSLLRGSIKLHNASNLTISNLKTQVEELLDKKRYLKGFSEDKSSKVNQALAFLNQLETISVMLRRVKVFRKEDVNVRNRDMYRNIAEAMRSPNIKRLPLTDAELNCFEITHFCQFFEGVNALVNLWEGLKVKIDDVHCSLPKLITQNQLSLAILQIFQLPELDQARQLCDGMTKYMFLEDTVQVIRKQIEQTEDVECHLEDSANYKKVSENIEQFKSSSTRKELQIYIQFLMKKRLPQLWFITEEIKNRLRLYWMYNKLTPLIYDPISLKDLTVAYTEALSSNKCNDFVKKVIRENQMVPSIEKRIETAEKLKEAFLGCLKMTPDKFFQLLSQLRNSSVQIYADDEDPSSEALDRYLAAMEKVERNFSTSKSNLGSTLSFEEYQQSTLGLPVPFKIEEFVKKQLREPIESERWFEKVLEQTNPHRLELEFLVSNRLQPDSRAFQALEKAFMHEESSLNKIETEVEEILLSSLFGSDDKVQSVRKTVASIDSIKYGCKGEQTKMLIKVLVWLLKETDLFDLRDSFDNSEPFLTTEMLELLHFLSTALKSTLSSPIRTFVLEELIKSNGNRHAEVAQIFLQGKSELKELEDLAKLVAPAVTTICELYTRVIDVLAKVPHQTSRDDAALGDLLQKAGIPLSTTRKIDLGQLFDSKTAVDEANHIQNELIESQMPPLDLVRTPYQALLDRSLELVSQYQKSMRNRFDMLVAAVEPVRSRRQSMCSPAKDQDATPTEKRKTANVKVSEPKKASKNGSDQKENEVESRGRLQDPKTRKGTEFNSRKQSQASVNGQSKDEENGQLVSAYDNAQKNEDKQLKKRKPEIGKEEKKEPKTDKKPAPALQKQGPGPKIAMFECVTLNFKDKKLDNKKVSFVSVAHGLTEKVIDEIGLLGHIDLEMNSTKAKENFENVKSLLKRDVPLIYGHLNCRSNAVSSMLDESLVWEGTNDRLGRVWLFNSKLDIEFVKEYSFLPSASMLASKSYYLFILEKRVDGKDVDVSGSFMYSRKGRVASPDGRKGGIPIVDETKSIRESKSRSIKGERATRSRKARHD